MNKKQWLGLGLVTVAAFGLAACGNRASRSDSSNAKTDLKAAIVTDTGGVDDKSFNQSAWEGLQAWGKENGLSKDNGFTYYQSNDESQYANNLNQAATDGYNLVYGIGFALRDAVESAAQDNTDINYVIVDDVIEGKRMLLQLFLLTMKLLTLLVLLLQKLLRQTSWFYRWYRRRCYHTFCKKVT